MNMASKRAQKVANDALVQAALSGVARAIAARQAAGVELSAGDVAQVSGGALVRRNNRFPALRRRCSVAGSAGSRRTKRSKSARIRA